MEQEKFEELPLRHQAALEIVLKIYSEGHLLPHQVAFKESKQVLDHHVELLFVKRGQGHYRLS